MISPYFKQGKLFVKYLFNEVCIYMAQLDRLLMAGPPAICAPAYGNCPETRYNSSQSVSPSPPKKSDNFYVCINGIHLKQDGRAVIYNCVNNS